MKTHAGAHAWADTHRLSVSPRLGVGEPESSDTERRKSGDGTSSSSSGRRRGDCAGLEARLAPPISALRQGAGLCGGRGGLTGAL